MLHDLTALEQGDAVRNGDVSPLELVEHYADRADLVGAFITTTHELARDHARRLGEAGRPEDAGPLWGVPTVLTAMSAAPVGRDDRLRPLTRWLGGRGHAVSGPEFGLAIGRLRQYAAVALAALAPYDVVLTPTLAAPPVKVGALRDDADPARDFANQKAFTPWTSAWNVTGMPAVSLPLHWTDERLPVGVMLAVRPAEEELLLSLAGQVEAAHADRGHAWVDRHPPGW